LCRAVYEIQLLVAGTTAAAEESAELALGLREELIEFGVDGAVAPSAPTPDGARGDALAWGQLVVTFAGSLPGVVAAIRAWRARQPRGAVIKVSCAGDDLILSDATAEQQDALVDDWLARRNTA
jgi:hypothetical protein